MLAQWTSVVNLMMDQLAEWFVDTSHYIVNRIRSIHVYTLTDQYVWPNS